MTVEERRIEEMAGTPDTWRLWGPYLSERSWGTVREDYSPDGSAWDYFPHDHARRRAYRWSEDGIAGICDIRQYLCFAIALWNGQDPFLKERLFGLTGPQGNHGEDVKEYWFYLDATPSHSYLKHLYKYPQRAFPYADLLAENARRRGDPRTSEYELLDTGVFAENRYFDVTTEYAKATPTDLAIRITVENRGPDTAPLWLIPSLWFRNRWQWEPGRQKPSLRLRRSDPVTLEAEQDRLGTYWLLAEGSPDPLFCENETDFATLYGGQNSTPYVKDGIDRAVVQGEKRAVNPDRTGTKAGLVYPLTVAAGDRAVVRLRLVRIEAPDAVPSESQDWSEPFDGLFTQRIAEAEAFYARLVPEGAGDQARQVQRQAFAGLIWSKQFYRFDLQRWLDGDPLQPAPPAVRHAGRNASWTTFNAADVLSMPDKWEYPWFAAWDLAFHMIPFAQIDPDFAKHQLLQMCREWYMHPNGQLPAYEWNFSDVNPPVHAWAALRVYRIERRLRGLRRDEPGDTNFLERIFHKLLLNFTWWVNRKDAQGNNVFEGGFLGLDNIGVFDRSAPLPNGGYIEQCDGTAWMAMFSLNMLAIAMELCRVDPTYQDVAIKFAEHFVYIGHALNNIGADGLSLWDEEDGFFYDVLHTPGDGYFPLRVRSIVGLIPLFAVEVFDASTLAAVPEFTRRFGWFLRHKPQVAGDIAHLASRGQEERAIFALVGPDRLRRILTRLLDPGEFLSPHGIRSLSRHHLHYPFVLNDQGQEYRVDYTPAESTNRLFGGNSNWRGPVWFPVNYLLIEALQKYDYAYGTGFQIACPTGATAQTDLWGVAGELSRRLISLFLRGPDGQRPIYGGVSTFQHDPHWRDHLLFFEYFHGDNGAGLGASHQTGWTALVAKLIAQTRV